MTRKVAIILQYFTAKNKRTVNISLRVLKYKFVYTAEYRKYSFFKCEFDPYIKIKKCLNINICINLIIY